MTNETQAIVSQFAALDIRSHKRTENRGPSIDLVIERKHSEVTVSGARERKKKKKRKKIRPLQNERVSR